MHVDLTQAKGPWMFAWSFNDIIDLFLCQGEAFTLLLIIIYELDIIVMGTITGAPLFCVLVTEVWNVGQGHKPPHGISRSCQDEQLI